jgi:hypothetical protein
MDWKSKDVATKDLIIGFSLLGSMVVVAVTIAIITSLT